ncbi:g2780 [Coccomyxa elongata]
MDPLTVLRDFVIHKRLDNITESEDGKRIHFGDRYSFPKDVATAYKSQMGKGDFYPLNALVFFMKNAKRASELIKLASEAGVRPVTFVDRKDLVAYLTGEKDTSDYIQLPKDDMLIPDIVPDTAEGEPAAKRARTDASTSGDRVDDKGAMALAELLGRERQLRDRNTQLLVPGRNFTAVLSILAAWQKKQQEREKQREQQRSQSSSHSHHRSSSSSKKEVIPVLPSRRFDRPTGEGLAAMGIDEYKGQQIDAYGARKSSAAASASTQAPPPPPPPPLPQEAPLPPPPPPPGHRSSRQPSSHDKHRHSSSARPAPSSQHKSRQKSDPSEGGIPIIIVPAAATATINMLNAKAFLEQGTYTFPQQVAEQGGAKNQVETFGRTIGRAKPVRYVVTNRAPDAKSHDWKRVVAVFVSGAAWQFKGWPFPGAGEGNLADTLSRMLGVYVGLKGEIMPENVKKWNVLKVEVPKDNRHRDRPIVQDIYTALDKFLAARQSRLKY